MGIHDRHYVREERGGFGGGGGGMGGFGVGRVRGWSANTWIIVICIGVFVINAFTINFTRWVQTGADIPPSVELSNSSRFQFLRPGREDGQRRYQVNRDVIDVQTGEKVGTVTFARMTLLHEWMHFSTARTVLKPLKLFEFWRFIGFQFLHADLTHLLFNMIGLFFFGPMAERYLGSKRYVAFYLLCGIFGAVMYLLLNLGGFIATSVLERSVPILLVNSPWTPLIGASAGVFGVIMAGAFLAPNTRVLLMLIFPMRIVTLAWGLVIIALIAVVFGGNNAGGEAAHLGGAIAGFYFIRNPQHLHGFFDILGRADPTSHHKPARAAPKQSEVDKILDKINQHGMHSLTEKEKRILNEASRK
ncbi:MAG: rhomboid family intramembrane serine protease [Planctomycetota bacterium]|jgi:membrane associated rhomboid family serine protease